ncbi:MAG: hypothetical protein AB7G18_18920 [Pyrinomonadaceae bacterium]
MGFRILLFAGLVSIIFAVRASSQPADDGVRPMSKADIRRAFRPAFDSEEEIRRTNQTLIQAVRSRGVDFVLSREEEWSLRLRDASDELIAAIRDAVPENEREARLRQREQESLYNTFATTFSQNDLNSKRTALSAANRFVEAYGDDPSLSEIVRFMKRSMPGLERSIRILERPVRSRGRRRAN